MNISENKTRNARGKRCVVPTCTSHLKKESRFSYHRFPNDLLLKQKWIEALKTPLWQLSIFKKSRLCSAHFDQRDLRKLGQRTSLAPDAIPIKTKFDLDFQILEIDEPSDPLDINVEMSVPTTHIPNKDKQKENERCSLSLTKKRKISSSSSSSCSHIFNKDKKMENERSSLNLPKKRKILSSSSSCFYILNHDTEMENKKSSLSLPKNRSISSRFSSSSFDFLSKNQQMGNEKSFLGLPKKKKNSSSSSCSSVRTTLSTSEIIIQNLKEKYQQKYTLKKKLRLDCKEKFVKSKCQKRKINSLENLLKELEEKNFISTDTNVLLASSLSITEQLFERFTNRSQNQILSQTYAPEIRSFALSLNFYSPKGYQYIREVLNLCLPHPKTLSIWNMSNDGSPGFTKESFDILKSAAENAHSSENSKLLCSLVINEMAIKRLVEWDGNMNHGYINLGNNLVNDSTELAREALVFIIVAINGTWKIPVAYFLTNCLNGAQKARLVHECISKVQNCNIQIISLTIDGTTSNNAMVKELGCNLENGKESNFFIVNEQIIRIFYDPCHMIKLIRNALGDKKILYRENGDAIKWSYLENLYKLQKEEMLHLGSKFKCRQLDYHKQKINERLATQIFSKPVAAALEFCLKDLKLEKFEGCEPTIEFIRNINNCFDILNSRKPSGFQFKKAICCQNFQNASNYIDTVISYIQSIKFLNRKTPFQGLVTDLMNVREIYKDYILPGYLKFLPTYKISQHHIELFFSSIRSHLGHNDNPTARQFKVAYKRLLASEEISETGLENCDGYTEHKQKLCCSSAVEKINISCSNDFNVLFTDSFCTEETDEDFVPLSECTEHIIIHYIAGFVAYKLKKKLKCVICISALFAKDDDYNFENTLIGYKTKNGLCFASKDVLKVCKYSETILKKVSNFNEKQIIDKLILNVIFNFVNENIFSSLERHILEQDITHNHFSLLLKLISYTYFNTRIIMK